MVANAYNINNWEMEARESDIQGYPWYKSSSSPTFLVYMKPCIKRKERHEAKKEAII